MPLEGFAERPVDGTIRGWAWDSDAPDQALVVEAFDGDTFYARATAELFADDLQSCGRRAGHCMFEIRVPPSVAGDVHVLVEGTGDRLRTPPSSDVDPMRDWLEGPGARIRANLLVHRLVQDLVGRPATSLELIRFAPQVATPYGIVRLVRTILDDAIGASLFTSREVVQQAYVGVLGRAADEGGLNSSIGLLHDGAPVSQLIRILVASKEFEAGYEKARPPNGQKELEQLSRALQAAITTLTLHATALHPSALHPTALHPTPSQPTPYSAPDPEPHPEPRSVDLSPDI